MPNPYSSARIEKMVKIIRYVTSNGCVFTSDVMNGLNLNHSTTYNLLCILWHLGYIDAYKIGKDYVMWCGRNAKKGMSIEKLATCIKHATCTYLSTVKSKRISIRLVHVLQHLKPSCNAVINTIARGPKYNSLLIHVLRSIFKPAIISEFSNKSRNRVYLTLDAEKTRDICSLPDTDIYIEPVSPETPPRGKHGTFCNSSRLGSVDLAKLTALIDSALYTNRRKWLVDDLALISFHISRSHVELIDKLVESGRYKSRADLIRQAIASLIRSYQKQLPDQIDVEQVSASTQLNNEIGEDDKVYISFRIPRSHVELIDKLVESGRYMSRSGLIRQAIASLIQHYYGLVKRR